MTVPTIVVTDYDYPDLSIERELAADAGVDLRAAAAETPAEVAEAGRGADGLLVQFAPVTADVFAELDGLAVVGRYGIGLDNVDVDAATDHGVTVVHHPSYCVDEVSTHAVTLALSCLRHVTGYDDHVHGGGWDWKVGRPLHRLSDLTLGLAGFGRIPRTVAEKASAFGLDVVAYDPYVPAEEVTAGGAEKVSFDGLLARSDAVSVHTPLTDDTRDLFDADAFAAMKESAVLVNTSRGAVVDDDALAAALDAGEIRAAALDVLPEEPPGDSPLLGRDDVVLTPHVAWYSEESTVELRRGVTEDVLRVLAGDAPERPANDVSGA